MPRKIITILSGVKTSPSEGLIPALVNSDWFGISRTMTAGETVAFGNICYVKSDGKMWEADANGVGTYPAVAMALAAISANSTGLFLISGLIRYDTWNWTPGLLYLSETAGEITQSRVVTSGSIDQIIGWTDNADYIYFNPSLNYLTRA